MVPWTKYVSFVVSAYLSLGLINPASAGGITRLLSFQDATLRVERQFLSFDVAERLYQELLEHGMPKQQDHHGDDEEDLGPHTWLFKGHAGTSIDPPVGVSAREALRTVLAHDDDDDPHHRKQSVVFRFELLSGIYYENAKKKLIHQVVPNRVLENEGTIHLYASSRGASALANHTDVTDIFVLQLDGVKDCAKNMCLNKTTASTMTNSTAVQAYDETEINGMICQEITLYPGDALYLPRRVVHSARASQEQASVHLTFAFAETQCLENQVVQQ